MSWSDALKDAVGNVVGEAKQTVWPELMKKVLGDEGLQTMLAKLKDAGFQAQVQSWLDADHGGADPQGAGRPARAANRQVARHSDGSSARRAGEVPARGGQRGRTGAGPTLGRQADDLDLEPRQTKAG